MQTDALAYGPGYSLHQTTQEGGRRKIEYWSLSPVPADRNYLAV